MVFPRSCDIFCAVVDNYGDIGVCWRLARQLAHEHGLEVRLWVDDLHSFGAMLPELEVSEARQVCRGIEICLWAEQMPEVQPADLVIGAFACQLPASYVLAMAARTPAPVWLNLEYLSAEDWVESHHGLPSPHPSLPLTKYFFFPGFTSRTGGLLIERDLLAQRDVFQSDSPGLARFWQALGVAERQAEELRVSLFCYENPAIPGLLQTWVDGEAPVTCLLPEGRAVPQVAAFFGALRGQAGSVWQRGSLRVQVLPFVEQPEYDRLLWACDVNFVRGEDSCVRAQWAARPFIWHIYPQHDGVHLQKLEALQRRYAAGLTTQAGRAVAELWQAWNAGNPAIAPAWRSFALHRAELARHGRDWAASLAGNDLALNLLDFSRRCA